jgi:carbamoyl-phosphate synthase small subunit
MYIENVLKYKNGQVATSPLRDSKPSPLLVDLLAKERVGVDLPEGVKNMMSTQGMSGSAAAEQVYAAGAA